MATSWPQETDENVNYTKLCRLLYDGGTLAVKTVFDGIVPPASLGSILATNQHKLLKLKKPTGRVLSKDQWDLLYPPSGGSPKSDDFDITLLFVLLRNICGLTPPPTGWDAIPSTTDTSLEANLVRIKYYRNKIIAHTSKAEVGNYQFQIYWSDIGGALVSLGLKQDDIDELKLSPLGEKDYNNLVEYWYLSDEDVKYHLQAIKTETSEIKKATSKIEADTAEMKSKLGEMESRILNTDAVNRLVELAHINYTFLIEKNNKLFHPSTRQWILDQLDANVKMATTEPKVVIIRAGPGMGKSILAAKICEIYKKIRLLGGCHFFQHSDSLRNNPRIMLQSIARQLCYSVAGYEAILEKKLKTLQEKSISDLNCEELFGVLFEEPLSQIRIDHNVVIVIDPLDECSSQFKKEIEDALNRKLSSLPSRVRFVITTRPLPSCLNLVTAVQLDIDPSDRRNEHDLKMFCTDKLTERNAQHLIDKIMKLSDGLFLVAYFVLDMIRQGTYSLSDYDALTMSGIWSVYEYYFTRVQDLIKPYINTTQSEDDGFFKMLDAMVASQSPMPKDMFYEILCFKRVEEVPRVKRKERNDAVHMLHTIFPVENDHVTVFDKSVADWLKLDVDENPRFSVSVSRGLQVLAVKCFDVLKRLKERLKPPYKHYQLTNSENFAVLRIGYVIESSSSISESQIDAILSDITVVAALLSVKTFQRFYWPVKKLSSSLDYLNDFLCRGSAFRHKLLIPLKLSFGHCLSIAGDLMLNRENSPLSPSHKKKVHHWLIENQLPHYTHQVVSRLPLDFQNDWLSSFMLFKVTEGLIVVIRDLKNYGITILDIENKFSFGKQKTLPCSCLGVIGVSPDKKHIILTSLNKRKLELYSVTKLKKKQEYDCPINDVRTYHIFGDAKQWYIVFVEDDSSLHILNGRNGKLHSTIKLNSDERLVAVGQSGNILIINILRNENKKATHCEFYTIHFTKPHEKIHFHISETQRWISSHESVFVQYAYNSLSAKFSHCGNFVVICYNQSVFVFNTNNGYLFKKCDLNINFAFREPLFISSSCLIMRYHRVGGTCLFAFYDLNLERLVYLTPTILTYHCKLLVQQTHTTDKFISAVYGLTGKELVKLEFHNLEHS